MWLIGINGSLPELSLRAQRQSAVVSAHSETKDHTAHLLLADTLFGGSEESALVAREVSSRKETRVPTGRHNCLSTRACEYRIVNVDEFAFDATYPKA